MTTPLTPPPRHVTGDANPTVIPKFLLHLYRGRKTGKPQRGLENFFGVPVVRPLPLLDRDRICIYLLTPPGGWYMPSRSLHSSFGKVAIYGAPLLLAIVEMFHPQPHDLLNLDVHRWLGVHYAQIALFPLSALAIAWLIRGRTGIAAAISRVALFVFSIGWTAWDSVAGLATGILVSVAQRSGTPDAWRAPIGAIWLHPIMGGGLAPFFAALGAVALSVGAVAAAIVLKCNGQSWGPVVLLGLSSFGITIFKTHAWPGGPLTFGGIAMANAWLVWERKSAFGTESARQTQATATPH